MRRLRFKDVDELTVLGCRVRKLGNGAPELRALILRYVMMRGCSVGMYFFVAKLLVCCVSKLVRSVL